MKSKILGCTLFLFLASSSWATGYKTIGTIMNNSNASWGVSVSAFFGTCGGGTVKAGQKLSLDCTDSQLTDTTIAQISTVGSQSITATTCSGNANFTKPIAITISGTSTSVKCTVTNDAVVGVVTPIIINNTSQIFKNTEFLSQSGQSLGYNSLVTIQPNQSTVLPPTSLLNSTTVNVFEEVYTPQVGFVTECLGSIDPLGGSLYVDIGIYQTGSTVTCKIW